MKLEYKSFAEAKANFTFQERWTVFDGNKENFNITHECVDRHPQQNIAIRLAFDDGRRETYTFGELSRLTSQFANMLARLGIAAGDRVALILNPSLEFYVSLFGILKRGAVVVSCLPLFGPEAIEYRVTKSNAKMIIATRDKEKDIDKRLASHIIWADELLGLLKNEDSVFKPATSAGTLAMMQFSSGTTGIPKAVLYEHAAATLAAVNVKLCMNLKAEDNYFCPSSPAWGHGIWYGSVGPLIFGNAIGAYSGKFKPEVFLEALEKFEITNISATPLVYRMVANSGLFDRYKLKIRRLNFTGGALDIDTQRYFRDKLGIAPCSFYGSTEVGVIILDYGYDDYEIRLGSMGKPMLGLKVAVIDEEGNELPPGEIGQVAVWRKGQWIRIGDAAYVDKDGYFWHKGRIDDIIISAGYTIGPFEIEEVLEKHPAVQRAAVVGSPDQERGEIVKAFIVTDQQPTEELKRDIQEFVKARLSKHEYPREIEFIQQLPETPDGKIKRKELKELERKRKLKVNN